MNAVSFCLWGDVPRYSVGAVQNAKLMPTIYPDWQMHLWYSAHTVAESALSELKALGVVMHAMDPDIPNRMVQRFLVHDIPGVTRYIIRDCDSRISDRDRRCVDQWINAETILHTIHDHPYHEKCAHIMGGLWGFAPENDLRRFPMKELLLSSQHSRSQEWGADQKFLDEEIWPRYWKSSTRHGKDIPIEWREEDGRSFCGEYIDENGNPNEAHRAMRS